MTIENETAATRSRRPIGWLWLVGVSVLACEASRSVLSPGVDLPAHTGGSSSATGGGLNVNTGGTGNSVGTSPEENFANGLGGSLGGEGGDLGLDTFDFTSICAPGCSDACPCVDDVNEERAP